MIRATVCFLMKDKSVLLGMKKRGFGAGFWNGIGGKIAKGESIETAVVRETQEEIGVIPGSLKRMAGLNFTFLGNPEWNQTVIVFISKKWSGRPKESEEMKPRWFPIKRLPLKKMWVDDYLWLPRVLEGKKLEGNFIFDKDQKLLKYKITSR